MRFQNVPLSDVIKIISNNFGYTVDYPEGCDFPVSSTFSTEDPLSGLQTIADLGPGELEIIDETKSSFKLILPSCD